MKLKWGQEHWVEIKDSLSAAMQRPDKDEIPKRLEKYDHTIFQFFPLRNNSKLRRYCKMSLKEEIEKFKKNAPEEDRKATPTEAKYWSGPVS